MPIHFSRSYILLKLAREIISPVDSPPRALILEDPPRNPFTPFTLQKERNELSSRRYEFSHIYFKAFMKRHDKSPGLFNGILILQLTGAKQKVV